LWNLLLGLQLFITTFLIVVKLENAIHHIVILCEIYSLDFLFEPVMILVYKVVIALFIHQFVEFGGFTHNSACFDLKIRQNTIRLVFFISTIWLLLLFLA
jgi:hypothetical protein